MMLVMAIKPATTICAIATFSDIELTGMEATAPPTEVTIKAEVSTLFI